MYAYWDCLFLQNSPKYIKCADEASALQFHYKVHTSIDIIEEKLNVGNKAAIDIRDLYLGLLFATEEYKMFVFFYNSEKYIKDITSIYIFCST